MRNLTFNKVYAGLLIIALISTLGLPKPISDRAKDRFQLLFMPVSKPLRKVIGPIYSRLVPQPVDVESPGDAPRTYGEIAEENRHLRIELANLMARLRKLEEINADREMMGDLRQVSRPFKVVGADTTLRRSLIIQGDVTGLRPGMAAVYPGGLAGRIDRLGWGSGAQVQLISDVSFRVTVRYLRPTRSENQLTFRPIGDFTVVLQGDGRGGMHAQGDDRGEMHARNLSMKQATDAGLQKGDWAVIADSDYPAILQGYRVGEVVAVTPARNPLFAEVAVETQGNLLTLQQVMVVVR